MIICKLYSFFSFSLFGMIIFLFFCSVYFFQFSLCSVFYGRKQRTNCFLVFIVLIFFVYPPCSVLDLVLFCLVLSCDSLLLSFCDKHIFCFSTSRRYSLIIKVRTCLSFVMRECYIVAFF